MQALDRSFVADIVADARPSVVLVLPRGVRNSTFQGSGFAVNVAGHVYVMTSAHVAAGGLNVSVALAADNFAGSHQAEVVGRALDPELDLALLRLPPAETRKLTPLELADSSRLRVGDFVVSLGHASDLRGAASLGILSGRGDFPRRRAAEEAEGLADSAGEPEGNEQSGSPHFLVTDAAMAGGMSGGPLLDAEGGVVGVNTLVRPEMGGIGNYAIASAWARQAAEAIVARAASLKENQCSTAAQVLLYNDRFNTRARVEAELHKAGLNEEEAQGAMLEAHRSGRSVVRTFDSVEEAEALRLQLAAADLLVEVMLVESANVTRS